MYAMVVRSAVGIANVTSGVPSKLNADKYDEYYTITVDETVNGGEKVSYKLVNTAGTVQKGKSKAKDGDGCCFDLKVIPERSKLWDLFSGIV